MKLDLHDAVALLSRFQIRDLVALGASDDDVDDVLGDSLPMTGDARGWWTMAPAIRASVIHRIADENRLSEVIREVIARIPSAEDDLLYRNLARLERIGSAALDEMQADDLAAIAPLLASVDGAIPHFPSRLDAEKRLGFLRLLEPFERLTGTHFRGRAAELRALRAYVGVLPAAGVIEAVARLFRPEKRRPFLIFGVGGAGKSTLVAKFILDHVKSSYRFPFAYLDYDRAALTVEEPASILIEATRQLALQYPEASEAAERLIDTWQTHLAKGIRPEIQREFASFVGMLNADSQLPLLLVLDTFEEVQYRSHGYVAALRRFLENLSDEIPRLRTVVVSRAPVPELAGESILELRELDPEAAIGFLRANGIGDDRVAALIVKNVSGNPLSLRLAVQIFQLEGLSGIEHLDHRVTERQIQGQLFERILNHVHDPDVRKLAYPGLVLRRVTAEIIREVLAEPCNVYVPDEATAQRLFDALSREVALVSLVDTGVLVHRADVRKLLLPSLREASPRGVAAIHENAIAYYSRFEDPVSRAEELYHRLCMRQPAEMIEPRFTPDLRPFLANALDELEAPEQAWLADHLGVEIPPEAIHAAALEVWERFAERTVRELLRQRELDLALKLVGERKERSAHTMLRVREAALYRELGRLDEAEAIAREATTAYDLGGNARALFETLIVSADIARLRGALHAANERLLAAERMARVSANDEDLARVLDERAAMDADDSH